MKSLRLSYSLLDKWMKGDKEGAIETYLRIDSFTNGHMERGKEFDSYVAEYAKKKSTLPPELGLYKVENPTCHASVIVPVALTNLKNCELTLKAEFDVLTSKEIIEVKNSIARDSADWADSLQMSLYLLVAELAKLDANRLVLFRYDPTKKEYDTSIIWKTDRRIGEASAVISTHAKDIYEYFVEEGII